MPDKFIPNHFMSSKNSQNQFHLLFPYIYWVNLNETQ